MNGVMLASLDDPGFVVDLFEFVTEMEIAFAKAQIQAGAQIIGIGDAAASLINDSLYREFALPYERRGVEAIREMGAYTRLHICGNATHHPEAMRELGAGMVDIDCLTGISQVREKMGDEVTVMGNLDPVSVLKNGTPEDVWTRTEECHRVVGKKFIIGPGCEVAPGTPEENLRVLTEYARSHS